MPPAAQVKPIRLLLVVPLLGEPLRSILNATLPPLLAPVLEGEPSIRSKQPNGAQTCYAIALHPGESIVLPLGPLGELGLAHTSGMLGVSVPGLLGPVLRAQLGAWIAMDHGLSFNQSGALVARFHLRPGPGMRVAMDMPPVGEVAVEAA